MNWNNLTKSEILEEIRSDWDLLLGNNRLTERDYHEFIRKHPAFFFNTKHDSYLTISKLKLGAEYETDFVIVKEGYSDGTIYEVIEIESPHTKLFDNTGKLTAKFNSAIQQIRDWKRWLIKNRTGFKKIFPTTSTRVIKDSRLRFKIIIGRREKNEEVLEKRRQIAESENIEILSFDRLTDKLNGIKLFPDEPLISAREMDDIDWDIKNQLANPFYICHSHSDWMKICKKGSFHIYSRMCKEIVESRNYNTYFEKFKKFHK